MPERTNFIFSSKFKGRIISQLSDSFIQHHLENNIIGSINSIDHSNATGASTVRYLFIWACELSTKERLHVTEESDDLEGEAGEQIYTRVTIRKCLEEDIDKESENK